MMFTLIRYPPWQVVGHQPVLDPAEVRDIESTGELLSLAAELQTSIEKEAAKRYDAAYRQGLTDGQAAARAEAVRAMAQLAQEADDYVARFDREIVALVVDAISRLLPSLGAEALLPDLAMQALSLCRAGRYLVLRVHPHNVESAEAVIGQWRASHPESAWVQVVPDAELGEFECVAQSDVGSVRADLDGVLAAVQDTLQSSIDASSDVQHRKAG